MLKECYIDSKPLKENYNSGRWKPTTKEITWDSWRIVEKIIKQIH